MLVSRIGLIAGILCYGAVIMKARIGYDDSLDVVGVHGVGGTWGAVATGLFASVAVNPDGANELFFGNVHQFLIQLLGITVAIVFSAVVTSLMLKLVDLTVGLSLTREEEIQGLDVTLHGEMGCSF